MIASWEIVNIGTLGSLIQELRLALNSSVKVDPADPLDTFDELSVAEKLFLTRYTASLAPQTGGI